MGRWVVLVHEVPGEGGGGWHYDWMIQPDGGGPESPLVSFRVDRRPDDPGVVAFVGERIADHRAAYLSFEGEISGGRGRVRRVASGESVIHADNGAFVVTLDGVRTWIGRRAGGAGGGESAKVYQFRLSNEGEIGHTGW